MMLHDDPTNFIQLAADRTKKLSHTMSQAYGSLLSRLDAADKLWLKHELSGYPDNFGDQYPDYRVVQAIVVFSSPRAEHEPVQFKDAATRKKFSITPIPLSVSQLEHAAEHTADFEIGFVPETESLLLEGLNRGRRFPVISKASRVVTAANLIGVLDSVRIHFIALLEKYLQESGSKNGRVKMAVAKKFQVFVSSTYEDLREQRNEVYATLLKHDCIPCGMELFSAGNKTQWETITAAIDLCDYYILIVARKYGTVDESADMSYTEKEFRYALARKIPVASLLLKDDSHWSADGAHVDYDQGKYTRYGKAQKLDEFKKFVKKDKMCDFWSTTGDLKSCLWNSNIGTY
jgi:hypothetical protein